MPKCSFVHTDVEQYVLDPQINICLRQVLGNFVTSIQFRKEICISPPYVLMVLCTGGLKWPTDFCHWKLCGNWLGVLRNGSTIINIKNRNQTNTVKFGRNFLSLFFLGCNSKVHTGYLHYSSNIEKILLCICFPLITQYNWRVKCVVLQIFILLWIVNVASQKSVKMSCHSLETLGPTLIFFWRLTKALDT